MKINELVKDFKKEWTEAKLLEKIVLGFFFLFAAKWMKENFTNEKKDGRY